MNTEQARFNMIEQQIRPWNVSSHKVLDLLSLVRREHFVDEKLRGLAFADLEIPLGSQPGQTMFAPKVEARLLQDLALGPRDQVLQIGAGSGYVSALLAKQSASVTAYELSADLALQAQQRLQAENIKNAYIYTGDALSALSENARFDVMVLCGSVARVPEFLLSRLRPKGRLWAVVGQEPVMEAVLIKATPKGYSSHSLWETVLPRLHGFPEYSHFHF